MGGVEQHVVEVSRRLADRGCAITVLTTDRSGTRPAREMRDGVEIRRVRAWPRQADLYLAPGLVPVIREGTWDVVHVQSYHTFVAPLAMGAAAHADVPFVLTFHGGGHSSNVRNRIRGLHRRALGPLVRKAAKLVALTNFEVCEYGRELGVPADRFAIIPNGMDLPRPAAAPVRDPASALIASVGRLERYKGHHRAVQALPHVIEREPQARLWIAGQGPYESELRGLARRLGVEDRVEIRAVPSGERDRMASELAATDLVVLLSDFETHPIAALEALALGLPVLLADNSGMRELASATRARALDPEASPRALADVILQELSSPSDGPPLQVVTWDDCADRLLELYDDVRRRAS
jgi:glycosyltransferase involved in cell wall biosynthesis